jgi:hypothetical protein
MEDNKYLMLLIWDLEISISSGFGLSFAVWSTSTKDIHSNNDKI